jgi:hypothetical protein
MITTIAWMVIEVLMSVHNVYRLGHEERKGMKVFHVGMTIFWMTMFTMNAFKLGGM